MMNQKIAEPTCTEHPACYQGKLSGRCYLCELDTSQTEVESLRAAVERVRAVHPEEFMGVEETWPVCGSCRDAYEEPMPYPCPTVRALDGEA